MEEFVEKHSKVGTPEKTFDLSDMSSEWAEYLKEKGLDYNYSVGSISETIVDTGDKMERYADQVSKDISSGREILEYRFEQDSIYGRLNYRLDAMSRDFDRMVSVMENLPEISTNMLDSLGQQAQEIMELINIVVNETFNNFDHQRTEMQQYMSEERESIMQEMQIMTENSLQTVLDAIPKLIGKVIGWIILLIIVVFGIPFTAGFWLGKLHEKKHKKSKGD